MDLLTMVNNNNWQIIAKIFSQPLGLGYASCVFNDVFSHIFFERRTGSETEHQAIRSAYLKKEGDIKYILKRVPFLSVEDESRVKILLNGAKYFYPKS